MRDFQQPGRSPVFATNGICATSHPLAAKVAVQIMESGGNAMDAAIGAVVLLGICEPQMTGLGGDCFVLLSPPDSEEVIALNGSGRAPAGLSAHELRASGHSTIADDSAHSVTVPGAVDAICMLANDWGKIGLEACLAPAIHYAEAGVPVAPRVAHDWANSHDRLKGAARKHYLAAGGVPDVGTIFRAPAQAEVLKRIAREGRNAFYTGEIADDMITSLRAMGGTHRASDFAATRAEYTTPVSGMYRDVELIEHPPNGQGATAILMNHILTCFDIAGMAPFGPQRAHIEAEAAKLAYDARNRFIADPDYTTRIGHMLAPETGQRLAALIDPARALPHPGAVAEKVHKDTVYLTVVDRNRMSVSFICSIYNNFGSGLASDKFGILFHNRGSGFTLTEGHPNEAGGGKRPMHTIIPGMLKQAGRITMPFGVMGGAYQPAGHARFLSNMVDFGMDPQAAIDAPRSFPDAGIFRMETGYAPETMQALADMGHNVVAAPGPIGGAQAVRIDDERGVLMGASDARKDGAAIGY